MNSLTLGFFYIVGLSWLMVETSLMAGDGSWGPFWLFLAGFAVMFSLLGCLPLSDSAVNKVGAVFAIIVGAALLLISLTGDSGVLFNSLKSVFAAVYLIFGIITFGGAKGDTKTAH